MVFTVFYCTKNICLVKNRGTPQPFYKEYFEKIGFEKYLVKNRPKSKARVFFSPISSSLHLIFFTLDLFLFSSFF